MFPRLALVALFAIATSCSSADNGDPTILPGEDSPADNTLVKEDPTQTTMTGEGQNKAGSSGAEGGGDDSSETSSTSTTLGSPTVTTVSPSPTSTTIQEEGPVTPALPSAPTTSHELQDFLTEEPGKVLFLGTVEPQA